MSNIYYVIYDGTKQIARYDAKDRSLAATIKEAEKLNATKIAKCEEGRIQSMLVVWQSARQN